MASEPSWTAPFTGLSPPRFAPGPGPVGRARVIADGGYRGTGLVIPHRHERGQADLPDWKEEHYASHRKVRARVERTFARMNTRQCSGKLPSWTPLCMSAGPSTLAR